MSPFLSGELGKGGGQLKEPWLSHMWVLLLLLLVGGDFDLYSSSMPKATCF